MQPTPQRLADDLLQPDRRRFLAGVGALGVEVMVDVETDPLQVAATYGQVCHLQTGDAPVLGDRQKVREAIGAQRGDQGIRRRHGAIAEQQGRIEIRAGRRDRQR